MDGNVCNLLQGWGLEGYIDAFRDNSISFADMVSMGPAQIEVLFPTVEHRILFANNLSRWRAEAYPNFVTPVYQTNEMYVETFPTFNDSYFLCYEDDSF